MASRLAPTPHAHSPGIAPDLRTLLERSGLAPLRLAGRTLLPIVQGGMGIGVSAHRLAGSVAALGGVGTLSSVDLRRHHPDLMERTQGLAARRGRDAEAKRLIDDANREALAREVHAARSLAGWHGPDRGQRHARSQRLRGLREGLARGRQRHGGGRRRPAAGPARPGGRFPDALLVPILSDARGVQLVVRKWERKKRMPDAIVIEHPRLAGGHLGAARLADLHDRRFDFDRCCPQSRAFLRSAGVEREVPLIAAGGIRAAKTSRKCRRLVRPPRNWARRSR